MKLSRITILWGLFIIISASFALQVIRFIRRLWGRGIPYLILWLIFIVIAFKIIHYFIKPHFSWPRKISIGLIFLAGLILALRIDLVAERFHLLEYGLLGWLSLSDLIKEKNLSGAIVWSLLFTLLVGAGDEFFQKFLPYRVCEIRDVFFNLAGGVWGICLFAGLKIKRPPTF
jgi:hypothetical protein